MTLRLAYVLGCAALVACTSNAAVMRAGPEGGEIRTGDGAAVQVPPGALAFTITISIERLARTPALPSLLPVGRLYRLGPEGQVFAKPVAILIPYDQSDGASQAARLAIYTTPRLTEPTRPGNRASSPTRSSGPGRRS